LMERVEASGAGQALGWIKVARQSRGVIWWLGTVHPLDQTQPADYFNFPEFAQAGIVVSISKHKKKADFVWS
jgi:hypothetical protein